MMHGAPPEMRGMGWRIPVSILVGVGWLAFVVIWLFFFASDHSIYKNVAVMFVSILLSIVVLSAVWIGFGLRMGYMYSPDREGLADYRAIRWRIAFNVLVVLAWSVFLLIWLFIYADGFTGYQNIAVVFVSVLIAGGLSVSVWAKWWRRSW